jgi:hypothetical protein
MMIWAQPSAGTPLIAPRPSGIESIGLGPRLPGSCKHTANGPHNHVNHVSVIDRGSLQGSRVGDNVNHV